MRDNNIFNFSDTMKCINFILLQLFMLFVIIAQTPNQVSGFLIFWSGINIISVFLHAVETIEFNTRKKLWH